ncbi:hypothetical protein EVAR_70596_1 [Eumeta japonica]|uniref:Uncharacterized protein n=1 Tax=Eumeta variegata TaxID=151549 RepID=A0A4C2AAZ3_EUMVA|nr:hypothetical protein EVAR_70596_1 [Eumeta japonica]
MLTDEFKEGRPKSVDVPQNIDAVRELIMQGHHVTYREIKMPLGISDESWMYAYDPETKQQSTVWVFQDDPNPTKVIRAKSTLKAHGCLFFWQTRKPPSKAQLHNRYRRIDGACSDSYAGQKDVRATSKAVGGSLHTYKNIINFYCANIPRCHIKLDAAITIRSDHRPPGPAPPAHAVQGPKVRPVPKAPFVNNLTHVRSGINSPSTPHPNNSHQTYGGGLGGAARAARAAAASTRPLEPAAACRTALSDYAFVDHVSHYYVSSKIRIPDS